MRINLRLFFLGFSPLILAGCGSIPEASSLTVQQMIINIADTMPSLIQMCTAAAYILGLLFVLRGVYKLKEYGESRTMMASQTNVWPPIMTILVGSMFIYFPSAYQVGLQTLFHVSTPSPISYAGSSGVSEELINAVVLIMQLVGCIAFIRGLLLLNSASGHGAQPGSYGKGITFIIGGLLAINMYGTWEVIVNTIAGV